jgi:MYXO-CTERM domain-containing protein
VTLLTAALAALASRPARACSAPDGGAPQPATALPRSGATDVSTATSFVIMSGSVASPVDVALQSGGVDVPLGPVVPLGVGEADVPGQAATFWQVKARGDFLPASADLVLSASDGLGGRAALTSVHTAAGYDKQAGTPAVLKSLTLTRVRYPIADIGAGTCVFSEYIGYLTFEADAAVIPGTPSDSVFNTISLAPKYGGAATQSHSYTGARTYSGDRVEDPKSSWKPFLDPTLEYCASITSFGGGDIARLPVRSNTLCARVQEISEPGAGDVPDAATDASPDVSPDASGAGGSSGATDGGAGTGGAGGSHDASAGADRPPFPGGDGPPSCAAAGGAPGGGAIALLLVAAYAFVARQRDAVSVRGRAAVSRARRARRS